MADKAKDQDELLHELIGAAGEVAIMVGPEAQDPRIRRLADLWRKWRNAHDT